jgi:hypothetical protein
MENSRHCIRMFIVPTAIEKLRVILESKQPIPDEKLEKCDFLRGYFSLKFKEFFSPDSEYYKSFINPIFSFEFEMSEEKFLEQVKVFSLRDGVMPLMRFFAIYKIPPAYCPLLIVDSQLSSLVPQSWRANVVLRTPFVEEPRKMNNKVILFCSPDSMSLPLDILENELRIIEKKLKPEDELLILFSSMRMRGEGHAIWDQSWDLKILLNISLKFNKRKITILSFKDYLKHEFSFSRFYFLNPLKFYFSDSFLLHDICQKGASPLLPLKFREGYLQSRVSLNHGFYFHQEFEDYRGANYDIIQDTLFHSIKTYAKSARISDINNKLYPKDFSDWGHDTALEIYRECQKSE